LEIIENLMMRVLKKVFLLVLIIALVGVLATVIYLTSQKPEYAGTLLLKGLKNQVEVKYDEYGIPHIYATNESDAYFALGYVHAQDRLFQMEMTRRVASGRLSEILGSDFIKIDAFFKTLGLEQHAKQASDRYLNSDTASFQKSAKAYLAGINQFINHGRTPAEFKMLGISPQPFTTVDLYLTSEFMAFNFAMAFRTDPLMSFIQKKLGPNYYKDLNAHYIAGTFRNANYQVPDTLAMHQTAFNTVDNLLNQIPIPSLVGSNAWVVAPAHSKSGKVLLANDTHIGYGQPCVWYEAHMEYPGFSFYGNYLGGFPFAALGHSREMAWGVTMFENDDLDFYAERLKPGDSTKYWNSGKWDLLNIRKEIIKVKGEADVTLTVRNSRHGPLMQDVMPEWKAISNNAVAASWTHLKFDNNLLQVTYNLNHAHSFADTRNAVSELISPGLNILYGDNIGNIAWWAAGKLVIRNPKMDPVLLQDGTNENNDVKGYYDFKDNPKSENPPSGIVFSANNQPDSMPGCGLYPGYYVPEDRAKRIEFLLHEKQKYSLDDMQRINTDARSTNAPIIAQTILKEVNENVIEKSMQSKEVAKRLMDWNGDHQLKDIGPTIYYKLIYNVLQAAMEDELGAENLKVFLNTHVMKNSLQPFMSNATSVWWDNVKTSNVKENRTAIFSKAFEITVDQLIAQLGDNVNSWEWGRVHIIEHVHPIGMKKPFNYFFNAGPFAVPGGQEVINQIAFEYNGTGIYKAKYGPAMRIALDFSDIENSFSVLPTGQSGNVMSPYYFDQAVMYNSGKSRKQKMNKVDINKNKTGRLLLQPSTH